MKMIKGNKYKVVVKFGQTPEDRSWASKNKGMIILYDRPDAEYRSERFIIAETCKGYRKGQTIFLSRNSKLFEPVMCLQGRKLTC